MPDDNDWFAVEEFIGGSGQRAAVPPLPKPVIMPDDDVLSSELLLWTIEHHPAGWAVFLHLGGRSVQVSYWYPTRDALLEMLGEMLTLPERE